MCAKPRRVEAKVGRLQVRLDGTEPGSTWSASPAAPVGWKAVDGCLKGTEMMGHNPGGYMERYSTQGQQAAHMEIV